MTSSINNRTAIMEDDVAHVKKVADIGLPHDLIIDGHFTPSWWDEGNHGNHLDITSLEGAPTHVPGDVDISVQKHLTSLLHSPQTVDGHFWVDHSAITSLVGGPITVGAEFKCHDTLLKDLVGAPATVGGDFICNDTKTLKSISMGERRTRIEGSFICDTSTLKNLVDGPIYVGKDVRLKKVASNSLTGVDKCFPEIHGRFSIEGAVTNVLSLFNIVGLQSVFFKDAMEVGTIINEFLPMGKKGMMKAQLALIKAGFKDAAKL